MRLFLILALVALPCSAPLRALAADEMSPEHGQVLYCLESMGDETVWAQCVNLLFASCATQTVGSPEHVSCLAAEHEAWRVSMDNQRTQLIETLTPTGASELTLLMGQWFGYVAQKCAAVAMDKSGDAAESAKLGCEISEIVGVTAEFVACRERRSTAPYCVMQE